MKKQIQKPKTAVERWPELDKASEIIANIAIREINKIAPHIKSECRYRTQGILEMTIVKLEKCV